MNILPNTRINLVIRKGTPADAAAVGRVGRQSFSDAFAHLFNGNHDLENYLHEAYSLAVLQESIKEENNVFFLAFDGEEVVGFARMRKIAKHPEVTAAKQTELQKIYVLKEHHGSGVAQYLMDAVIHQAKQIGTDVLWLIVNRVNEKAIRFYKKNGFEIAGYHLFVIGSHSFDHHVMALPISTDVKK